ncbi:MerR family transcriptional regulator [Actinokineospora sp. NBRC 105648]|uniref:MerR family transcriptional regulator n=1 Tax=Actinokineospora sp. NBRC 105648 TaxID=3032206 RepID=UPI0024A2D46C|nr:MerR family transcriptional regulator [Actinokineospora sp. NBRC 105648]GLZ38591.1 MerR family transcriptional regulator [Actinokineospora sp. NBRC 105648]
MRIGELSKRSGVAVPTIKYYLREGMLPPGERTSPNQARYDDTHLHRLRLVRALIDVGGLSVAAVRGILSTVDAPESDMEDLLKTVQKAVLPVPEPAAVDAQSSAEKEIHDLVIELGWDVSPKHFAVEALATVLVTARSLGHDRFLDFIRRYGPIMQQIGVADLDYVVGARTVDDLLEAVVVGTVLGDSVMITLRRLAQASETATRFPGGGDRQSLSD